MKVLLEIRDDRASFFIELLKSLPFVKFKTLTPAKAQFLEELREAVDAVNLVKSGKAKARPLSELLTHMDK
ncbi:MAG: hypothetical protein ACKVUS_06865 [Saprospiraceae bacterium]